MANPADNLDRYQRQVSLTQIGRSGQEQLAGSRVLIVGCGALGCAAADQLARAGVGWLRLADRDLVELSNLQRQTLFDEEDAHQNLPKCVAAANRLRKINSTVQIDPRIIDVDSGNVEDLAAEANLILDGTDNVATRYLLNDLAVKKEISWVYGGCVGTEGRAMAVRPGKTACLRCIFPQPPDAKNLPTCDTFGVLGAAAAATGAVQAALAIKLLIGDDSAGDEGLIHLDLWTGRAGALHNTERQKDCPCCARHKFEFLEAMPESTASVCGQNAVQVRGASAVDLIEMAARLTKVGAVRQNRYFLRCVPAENPRLVLTLFADGRLLVHGTTDPGKARAMYSRWIGN